MTFTIFDVIREKIERWMAEGRPDDYKEERWQFVRRAFFTAAGVGVLFGIGLIVLVERMGLSQATQFLIGLILLCISFLAITHKPNPKRKARMDMWWRGELPMWRFFWLGKSK